MIIALPIPKEKPVESFPENEPVLIALADGNGPRKQAYSCYPLPTLSETQM